jgi:hypothetical protein
MQEISSRSAPIAVSDQARTGNIVVYWTDNHKAAQALGGQPRPICVPALRASLRGFAKMSQDFAPGTLFERSRLEVPQLLGNQGSE